MVWMMKLHLRVRSPWQLKILHQKLIMMTWDGIVLSNHDKCMLLLSSECRQCLSLSMFTMIRQQWNISLATRTLPLWDMNTRLGDNNVQLLPPTWPSSLSGIQFTAGRAVWKSSPLSCSSQMFPQNPVQWNRQNASLRLHICTSLEPRVLYLMWHEWHQHSRLNR